MAELVVGTFTPSVLLRVARRIGAFDAAALTVREQPVASSPAQFRALLRGDLDAVLTSPDNVVAYRFVPDNPLGHTADVRILLGVDRGLGLALYARPGLASAGCLRGGLVGVDVANSGFAFALYELLASLGLHRYRGDYRVVELGATPRRLDALLAGECDATMLNAGNDLLAVDAGCRRLLRVIDVTMPYLGTVLAVLGPPGEPARALATALRDTADEIVRGVADRIAVEEAAEALGLPWLLARGYVARMGDPRQGLVPGGGVERQAMANVVGLRRRHGGILPENVLDTDDGLLEIVGQGHGA